MTQDRNTTIAEALDRLFRTYQQSDRNADPGDLARERMARAKVYFEAVSIYEPGDVEQAVMDFITGNVPGHNPAFAPSAPQVGSAVRRAMERRLEAARLNKLALPPPPDEWVDDAPDVKAKNKARLDALAADLAAVLRTEEAETERKRQQLHTKTNMRFDPSRDEASLSKRLGIGGARFTVGDPDEQNGDMGNRGAA